MLIDINGNKLSTVTKYGMISDVHENFEMVKLALEAFKKEEVDKIILNGDFVNHSSTSEERMQYMVRILSEIGKTGIESFIQPGSHEQVREYFSVMNAITQKFPNIIDALNIPELKSKDHNLYFIPGSDYVAGGEFTFTGDKKLPTSAYFKTKEGIVPVGILNTNKITKEEKLQLQKAPLMGLYNVNDLENLVKEPEKSVIICHVPRKFKKIDVGVDMAYFAEHKDYGGIRPGNDFDKAMLDLFGEDTKVSTKKFAKVLSYNLQRKNSGNKELSKLYDELGITKAINGHFHESGHRAHDKNENKVNENEMTEELFWNSGHLDVGQAGILSVKENKASYKNLDLNNYFNKSIYSKHI